MKIKRNVKEKSKVIMDLEGKKRNRPKDKLKES